MQTEEREKTKGRKSFRSASSILPYSFKIWPADLALSFLGAKAKRGTFYGTSLVVQWVRLHTPNAGDLGSIPGQGTRSHMHAATKSLHATTKKSTYCN